jgi:uncharacterized protein YprB with RNaseH-like and TPR domain
MAASAPLGLRPLTQQTGDLPWDVHSTAHGASHRVAQACGHDFLHGRVAVAGCQQVQAEHLAALALNEAWLDVDLSRLLFLDTETTGLAGGAGTLAFVVGLGFFTPLGWCTEQLILRQPGEEGPLLRRLSEHLERASALVTYNGKSFDWPLLKMRYIINRQPMPPLLHHLDLLHCVRRVYKRQKLSFRLIHLETRLLDFFRQGDIDGAAIPELYFAYLRGAPAATLMPVIHHNALDLHAMAALLGTLGETLAQPTVRCVGQDCLSIAELYLRAGKEPTAHRLAASVEAPDGALHGVQAHLMVGRLCRRAGDLAGCELALLAALRSCSDALPLQRASVHLQLAKFYEHRRWDGAKAAVHAAQAGAAEASAAHVQRLLRLERKRLIRKV